jgi:glyoxylase-like metal-dependent hydrolase (beta-lactamase superfamily II)
MGTLHVLDHGCLEIDRRLHYPLDGLATRSNPDPDVVRETVPAFSMVYEGDGLTLGIDTGPHPEAMAGHWPEHRRERTPWLHDDDDGYERRLESAGFRPADLDAVVQTHLHGERAGNLDLFADAGVPVYAHEEELEYAFFAAHALDGDSRGGYVPADYTHDGLDWRPLAGECGRIDDGIEWRHLPGHAPGTVGLVVTETPEPVLVVGDAVVREGNLRPEVVQPGRNYDHAAWADVTVPRVLDTLEEYDPNAIYGQDPERYGVYAGYPGVEVHGETVF